MLIRELVVFMAALLALGTAVNAWRSRSFGLTCLAGWLATVVVTGAMIALSPTGQPMPELVRLGMPLFNHLGGVLMLAFVIHAVTGRRLAWFWALPLLIHVLLALALGERLNAWITVRLSIQLEFVMTGVGWLVYWRGTPPPRFLHWPIAPVLGVLLAVTTLHFSQAAIMLGLVGPAPYYHLVFLVIGAWFLVALLLAVTQSPVLRTLVPNLVPVADDEDRALFERVEQTMQAQRPWADPDLEVGDLAARVGASANAVSRALNRAGMTSFYDYVNAHRVREAERLLLDPAEARYKVEALGRQAGFRARSTFFKVFRAHTGLTPAEYRRRHAPDADGAASSPLTPARTGSGSQGVAGREG